MARREPVSWRSMSDPAAATPTATTPAAAPAPAAQASPAAPAGNGAAPLSKDSDTGRSLARKIVLGLLLVLCVVWIALIIAFFGSLRHWVALHTGILHGGPDLYYNFWSGIGSDLGEATLITAVGLGGYTGVRKVNCHTKGCWRIGHHPLEGTPYILCRKHHPYVPTRGASHEHILEVHRKFVEEAEKARRH
jgi:hypothetical protein